MVLRGLAIDKKPLKDHFDAVGHKEALDYVSDLVKEKAPLSEYLIKQIRFLVLAIRRQDRGVYRSVPVRIAGALIAPSDPPLIHDKMGELIKWYSEEGDGD